MKQPAWLKEYSKKADVKEQITLVSGPKRAGVSVSFTGPGENGIIEPNKPVDAINTNNGTRMIHEGEMKIIGPNGKFAIIPADKVPQEFLEEFENNTIGNEKGKIPGYAGGYMNPPTTTFNGFGQEPAQTIAKPPKLDETGNVSNTTEPQSTMSSADALSKIKAERPAAEAALDTKNGTGQGTISSPLARIKAQRLGTGSGSEAALDTKFGEGQGSVRTIQKPPDLPPAPTPEDGAQALALKQTQAMATGESQLAKTLANIGFGQLDARTQTDITAEAMRIANDPNMTEGAKRAHMASIMRNAGIERSDLAGRLAIDNMARGEAAIGKSFDMAQTMKNFKEGQRITNFEMGQVLKGAEESKRRYDQEWEETKRAVARGETSEDFNALWGQYESALSEADATGDYSRAEEIYNQLAGNPDYADWMPATAPDFTARRATTQSDKLTGQIADIIAQNPKNRELAGQLTGWKIREYLEMNIPTWDSMSEHDKDQMVIDYFNDQYDKSLLDAGDLKATVDDMLSQYQENNPEYFDTEDEKRIMRDWITDMVQGDFFEEVDGEIVPKEGAGISPWDDPRYEHFFLKSADGTYLDGWDDTAMDYRKGYLANIGDETPMNAEQWKAKYDDGLVEIMESGITDPDKAIDWMNKYFAGEKTQDTETVEEAKENPVLTSSDIGFIAENVGFISDLDGADLAHPRSNVKLDAAPAGTKIEDKNGAVYEKTSSGWKVINEEWEKPDYLESTTSDVDYSGYTSRENVISELEPMVAEWSTDTVDSLTSLSKTPKETMDFLVSKGLKKDDPKYPSISGAVREVYLRSIMEPRQDGFDRKDTEFTGKDGKRYTVTDRLVNTDKGVIRNPLSPDIETYYTITAPDGTKKEFNNTEAGKKMFKKYLETII